MELILLLVQEVQVKTPFSALLRGGFVFVCKVGLKVEKIADLVDH